MKPLYPISRYRYVSLPHSLFGSIEYHSLVNIPVHSRILVEQSSKQTVRSLHCFHYQQHANPSRETGAETITITSFSTQQLQMVSNPVPLTTVGTLALYKANNVSIFQTLRANRCLLHKLLREQRDVWERQLKREARCWSRECIRRPKPSSNPPLHSKTRYPYVQHHITTTNRTHNTSYHRYLRSSKHPFM